MTLDHPDRQAWFSEALERYERPLVVRALGITGELESARDVVQETFLKLARTERSAVDGRLAEWLYTVCRNRALDELRKQDRWRNAMDDARAQAPPREAQTDLAPPAALERAEDLTRVKRALSSLSARQREAVLLKFERGLSYKEIAAVLEISVGTVGWLLHEALAALRARLADLEPQATEGSLS